MSCGKRINKGVKIGLGTDAAVYPHGRNTEEFHLLTALGLVATRRLASGDSRSDTSCSAFKTLWGLLRPANLPTSLRSRVTRGRTSAGREGVLRDERWADRTKRPSDEVTRPLQGVTRGVSVNEIPPVTISDVPPAAALEGCALRRRIRQPTGSESRPRHRSNRCGSSAAEGHPRQDRCSSSA